jgi:hypothetical protein
MNLIFSVADQPRTGGKSIGTLNNSLNLLRHLARTPGLDRITPLANHTLDGLLPTAPHVHIRWHDAPTRGRLRRLWWDQVGLYAAARQAAGDWMFLPKGFTPLWGRPPCRLAVNVNDLMATYYKQHYPRGFPPVELAYFEQSLIATIRRAHLIVTISQFTADELARFADQHKLRLPRVLPIGIGFSPGRPALPHQPAAPGGETIRHPGPDQRVAPQANCHGHPPAGTMATETRVHRTGVLGRRPAPRHHPAQPRQLAVRAPPHPRRIRG